MASSQSTKAVTLIAGEDLRASNSRGVYSLLTIENDGGVGKVIATTAATDTAIGVLAEEPDDSQSTDGLSVPVVMLQSGGVVLMKADGAITAGDLVVADTDAGQVVSGGANIAALANDVMAVGVALATAADGDIFPVLAAPMSSAANA